MYPIFGRLNGIYYPKRHWASISRLNNDTLFAESLNVMTWIDLRDKYLKRSTNKETKHYQIKLLCLMKNSREGPICMRGRREVIANDVVGVHHLWQGHKQQQQHYSII